MHPIREPYKYENLIDSKYVNLHALNLNQADVGSYEIYTKWKCKHELLNINILIFCDSSIAKMVLEN